VDKEQLFITSYLLPSADGLDRSFTLPLPAIPGLKQCGEFIVQGHLDTTYSTNIITKFEGTTGYRLVQVYKNTEDRDKGIFIRLVGTMSLVSKGYPFLFIDAAVSNLNFLTFEKEGLSTRVAIHLPQAEPEQRKFFFDKLTSLASRAGIAFDLKDAQNLPEFWGQFWTARFDGADFDRITALRSMAWTSYDCFCKKIQAKTDFDYLPVQEQIVFKNAQAEHHIFKKMGLSVSVEAQAAFFSMLVSGI